MLLKVFIDEVYLFIIENRILNISADAYRFQFIISKFFAFIHGCNGSELKTMAQAEFPVHGFFEKC